MNKLGQHFRACLKASRVQHAHLLYLKLGVRCTNDNHFKLRAPFCQLRSRRNDNFENVFNRESEFVAVIQRKRVNDGTSGTCWLEHFLKQSCRILVKATITDREFRRCRAPQAIGNGQKAAGKLKSYFRSSKCVSIVGNLSSDRRTPASIPCDRPSNERCSSFRGPFWTPLRHTHFSYQALIPSKAPYRRTCGRNTANPSGTEETKPPQARL